MSRCVICDYATEFDNSHHKRTVTWSDQENGYVCHVCAAEIYQASYQPVSIGQTDAGEIPTLDVEQPELLAERYLEESPKEDRDDT